MKNVLMVAYYFPPLSTSGAFRPLGFCRYLPEWGWAPRVVSADPWTVTPQAPIDAALGRLVPPAVQVHRVGHPVPMETLIRMRNAVRQRIRGGPRRPAAAVPAAATHRRLRAVHALVDLALDHLLHVPDPQRWWQRPAVHAAASGARPDLVYATGGPWTSLLVGSALSRRYGVPFVADFRDPWSRNPYRTFAPFMWGRHRRLERRVCRAAARVVVNTVELRDQFAADYPDMRDKFIAVSNGFDESDGSAASAHDALEQASTSSAGARGLELWHFGTVYGQRTPGALLEAASALCASGRLAPGRLRIRFVGAWELTDDDAASRLASRLEAAGIVTREPQIPHAACLAMMRRAPALLVLQPGSPLQVPGKIFEYIAARRPLLIVGGEGATASLVDRHRLGRCVSNDVSSLSALLAELTGGHALSAPPAAAVEQFSYRVLTRQLARVFDAVAA